MAVRLSDVGARWVATAAALCAVVSGCGQAATLTTAPARDQRPQKVTPAVQSPAGNRHAAQQEAARLLSLAQLPPGAVATSARPQGLEGPAMGAAVAKSLVDRTRFWQVPTGFDATMAWIRAHPPQHLQVDGSTSGSGPSYRMAGVGYSERDRPGMQNLELVIGAATLPGGGTVIRADGMAIWLDPRPLPDERRGKRLAVTVAGGCPRSDTGASDVRPGASNSKDLSERLLPAASPTGALICDYSGMNGHPAGGLLRAAHLAAGAAHRLTRAVDRLSLAHPVGEVFNCPFGDGTASVLAFSFAGRADVDLWLDRNGCAFVANGIITTRAGDLAAAVRSAERAAG